MKERMLKYYLLLQAFREDQGQDLIEYVLVAGIVALGAVAGMQTLGTDMNEAFSIIGSKLQTYTT